MQTRIYCALMALVILIGLSVDARAQSRDRMKVTMGQEFVVRGVTMPAGDYEVAQMNNWSSWFTLKLEGPGGHSLVVPVRATHLEPRETVGRPAFVLVTDTEGLTLKRVLLGGDQAFEVIQSPETN